MAKPKNDPNKPVTMKDLDEFVQAILAGTEGLFNELSRQMNSRFEKVYKLIDKVDRRLDTREAGQAHLEAKLNGLKADLSATRSPES